MELVPLKSSSDIMRGPKVTVLSVHSEAGSILTDSSIM